MEVAETGGDEESRRKIKDGEDKGCGAQAIEDEHGLGRRPRG